MDIKNFQGWTLSRKILVTSNLVSVVLMVGIAGFILHLTKVDAHSAMDSKIQVTSQLLKKASASYVWNLDADSLQGYANEIIKDPEVDWIRFQDEKGNDIIPIKKSSIASDGASVTREVHEDLFSPNSEKIGSVSLSYNSRVIDASIAREQRFILLSILLAQSILSLALWLITARTSKSLKESIVRLKKICEQTQGTSKTLKQTSSDLAHSGREQAAAVQQTAATLNEITSMVHTTVKSAQRSEELGKGSHEVAMEGKKAVDGMIHSIAEIDSAIVTVMSQVDASNQKVGEILDVINQIAEKTKVINEIVFQTRLLSFNASVEAARAGENGKGFAVVAEEVGHLAEMSGAAAMEIGQLLESSISRVHGIIDETRSSVNGTVDATKSKVENGINVAKSCGDILEKVVSNASEVGHLTADISNASNEQAKGVNEITSAMNSIEKSANSTAVASQAADTMSDDLESQAASFIQVVEMLEQEVLGSANATLG